MFMPRFQGDLTMQYRKDDRGRFGVAFSLGDGERGEQAQFFRSGGLGFVPGGRRITSVMQTRWPEEPNEGKPYIEGRCGGCSASALTLGRDVGSFYPSTNNGLLALWDHCMKLGAGMYNVDTHRLRSAWANYTDAWADGLTSAWNNGSEKGRWGTGAWRCAVREATRMNTVGIDDQIGVLSFGGPVDGCSDSFSKKSFRNASIFIKIIKRALDKMLEAQRYYLEHTTIAAYVAPDNGSSAHEDIASRIFDARKRILVTPAK